MACGKEEVSLSPSQLKLFLDAVKEPATEDAIARFTGLPIFKVRSSLRELTEAGYIETFHNEYTVSNKGKEYLVQN
ncbi:hypothetical protein EDD68_11372 [Melghiribacillus thermohalophilus]|uniref:Uncharacterized protein n=1 Tax=Melghiribacillus thermohalophilus TaxID=1324956 RepID=A0A4R3MVE7_9BACI|nr:hypothetical protein EDD68_11372 [Melghiribacillus thermohalophilus]